MVFMVIALCMSFVLRYLLAKYPYPELVQPAPVLTDKMDTKGEDV